MGTAWPSNRRLNCEPAMADSSRTCELIPLQHSTREGTIFIRASVLTKYGY